MGWERHSTPLSIKAPLKLFLNLPCFILKNAETWERSDGSVPFGSTQLLVFRLFGSFFPFSAPVCGFVPLKLPMQESCGISCTFLLMYSYIFACLHEYVVRFCMCTFHMHCFWNTCFPSNFLLIQGVPFEQWFLTLGTPIKWQCFSLTTKCKPGGNSTNSMGERREFILLRVGVV